MSNVKLLSEKDRKIVVEVDKSNDELILMAGFHAVNIPSIGSAYTKIETFEAEHPHSDFNAFTQALQRGQGRSLRMPGNFATADYSKTSYASAMKDEQQWVWHREVERYDIEIIDLKPVVRKFVAMQSTISPELRDLAIGTATITKIDFDWRQSDHADPLKGSSAAALDVKMGFKSHPQAWAERQLDPEDQYAELMEWGEKMKKFYELQVVVAELQSRARSQNVSGQGKN